MKIKGESGKELGFTTLQEYPNFYYGLAYRLDTNEYLYPTTVPKFKEMLKKEK